MGQARCSEVFCLAHSVAITCRPPVRVKVHLSGAYGVLLLASRAESAETPPMTSEPLFPLPPSAHWTYVRVVELWELKPTVALEGVCRSCGWKSPHVRAFYHRAWEDCMEHHERVQAESLAAGSGEGPFDSAPF